jgi:hypothetical protein
VISSKVCGWVVSASFLGKRWMNIVSTHHSSHTPDVGTGAPLRPEDDFGRAVLSCLNVVCEVVSNPACITQIGDFDGNDIDAFGFVFVEFFRGLDVCGLTQVHS